MRNTGSRQPQKCDSHERAAWQAEEKVEKERVVVGREWRVKSEEWSVTPLAARMSEWAVACLPLKVRRLMPRSCIPQRATSRSVISGVYYYY